MKTNQQQRSLKDFELEQNQEKIILTKLLAAQRHFYLVTDKDGIVIRDNRETAAILGCASQTAEGLSVADLLENGFRVWNFIRDKVDKEKHLSQEMLVFVSGSGELVRILSEIYPVQINQDQNYYIIEGIKSAQEEPQTQDALMMLEIFADRIANEVLNPLNVIQGRIQLIKLDELVNEKFKHTCETLEKHAIRIQTTIERLLKFARLRQDSVPEKIDIAKVIQNVTEEWNSKQDIETDIVFNSSGEKLPLLLGSLQQFEAFFSSVIEFIIKESNPENRIVITTTNQVSKIKIKVEENQIKYSMQIEKLLAEPFYTHEKNDARTGIIETIIQIVLHTYKGELEVVPSSGGGIALVFYFPIV